MGNCFGASRKSAAEIAPYDGVKAANVRPATAAAAASSTAAIHLYGSPTGIPAAYIKFALQYKAIPFRFTATQFETPVLEVGSETISGCRDTLLRYLDARFPNPPLAAKLEGFDEATPLIVKVTWLQHRSLRWHLERMVRWADDLATRGGRKAVDPSVGSPRMEVKKFGKGYSQLLELLLEHAQMEERVVFPVLEMADRGLCKAAHEEHARDLPIMNGIKEDIKSVGVLDLGTPACQEALSNISTRFKSLQVHCKEHFEEEERELLPLMEATELSKEQELRVLDQCVDVMRGTHSHLFKYFLEGLLPQEAMLYLDLITECGDRERTATALCNIVE